MGIQARRFSLFPLASIARLKPVSGGKWVNLVKGVAELPETHPRYMAYTLLMRQLYEEVGPNADSPCMVPSCVDCALNVLKHYDGSERQLLAAYRRALAQVDGFLAGLEELSLAA